MYWLYVLIAHVSPILAFIFWLGSAIVLLGCCLFFIDPDEHSPKEYITVILVGLLSAWFFFSVVTHEPTSEGRSTYVASEHGLTSLSNNASTNTETSTTAGFLYYASKTKVDDKWVYNVIQTSVDDQGQEYSEIKTYDADTVRVYQDNSRKPQVIEYRSHEKVFDDVTGEWEYVNNELDYIALIVPEGSIVENISVSVSQDG